MNVEALREKLARYKQSHLLRFWDELPESKQNELYQDIASVNFDEANKYFKKVTNETQNNNKILDDRVQPIPKEIIAGLKDCSKKKLVEYEELGLREVADGKVAVLLMAGGQGTRLGVSYPKGMYDLGLPSHKTLYRIQAERILRLEELAEKKFGIRGAITWWVY